MTATPEPDFADVLKLLRADARLTQEELAGAAGLGVRTVSDLERGVSRTARKATAGLLADSLGLTGAVRAQFLECARGTVPAAEVLRSRAEAGAGAEAEAGAGLGANADQAGVRYSLPPDTAAFTGRDAESRRMIAAVADATGAVAIQAIHGMPGVGKTALAVHVAHALRNEFPDRQLFIDLHGYTPGREPVRPRDALAGLLSAVGVDPQFLPDDLPGLAGMWRDRTAGQRALLVLDNAAGSSQVIPLLPGAGQSLVLVTSRRYLGDLPGVVSPVLLDALPSEQAERMFIRLAARTVDRTDEVAQVAVLAGRLPLAISLLARVYARHSSWTLADLVTETRAGLLTLTAENETVAAAFEVSYRNLAPARQRFFRLLGLHPGVTIDAYAAAALAEVSLAEAARLLDGLHAEGLLTETGHRRYGLHDLLRSYAHDLVAGFAGLADSQRALDRVLDYYLYTAECADVRLRRRTWHDPTPVASPPAAVPDLAGSSRATEWLRAERVNLLACLDRVTEAGQRARVVAFTAALTALLRQDGPWADGVARHETAARAAREAGDQPGEAYILNQLGTMRHLIGDFRGSQLALKQALDIYGELGDELGRANTQLELGVVGRFTGKYRDAVRSLEAALGSYADLGDQLGQANSLLELGACRRRLEGGDNRASAQTLQEALSIYRQLGNRPGQANALNFLGNVHQLTGDYVSAIRAQQAALAIYRELGNAHGHANALNSLGNVWRQTGRYVRATRALEGALSMYRDLGYRMGWANALKNLAVVRRLVGDLAGAARALETALDTYRVIGDRGGEVEALNEAGALRLAGGDLAGAESYHGQALELARELGSSWDEAHALAGLGRMAMAAGGRAQARANLRMAHKIFEDTNAAEAPQVAAELDALSASDLLEDLNGVALTDDAGRRGIVGDEVDAEPDLAVPAAVASQAGDGLVALRGGVRIDGGQNAAAAALHGTEGDRADAESPPAVLGPGRSA